MSSRQPPSGQPPGRGDQGRRDDRDRRGDRDSKDTRVRRSDRDRQDEQDGRGNRDRSTEYYEEDAPERSEPRQRRPSATQAPTSGKAHRPSPAAQPRDAGLATGEDEPRSLPSYMQQMSISSGVPAQGRASQSTSTPSYSTYPAHQGAMQTSYASTTREANVQNQTPPPTSSASRYTVPITVPTSQSSTARTAAPQFSSYASSSSASQFQYSRSAPERKHFTFTAEDPTTQDQTYWEITPALDQDTSSVSERSLTFKYIRGSPAETVIGSKDRRPQDARRRSTLEGEIRIGIVIEAVLVAPLPTDGDSLVTPNAFWANRSYGRRRRFVVISVRPENRNSFQALAIKTYNGQGVSAPRVPKSHHCIIYTGNLPLDPLPEERPQRMKSGYLEDGMQPQHIRVIANDRGTALDPLSRLDFTDRYEFDYGVPNIDIFGYVHQSSTVPLRTQYTNVWAKIANAVAGPGSTQGATSNAQSVTMGAPGPSANAAPAQARYPGATTNTTSPLPTSQASYGAVRPSAPVSTTSFPAMSRSAPQGTAPQPASVAAPSHSASASILTEVEMSSLLQRLQMHAASKGLTAPSPLPQSRIQFLASNAAARQTYLQSIKTRWEQEEEEDDGDDDDDDDDDDDND